MQRIDKELLKKRAEHNDGCLETLEEITLHQFDIEKIENLDIYCKKLKIILLQNNQIMKIENLSKLKSLTYLNLAINNIKLIENLEGCESLKKLDLTLNFIEDLTCVKNLKSNIFLEELFLVGNPCYQIEGYRNYVLGCLTNLKQLDSVEIERSDKIIANQEFLRLDEFFTENSIKIKEVESLAPKNENLQEDDDIILTEAEKEKKRESFQTKISKHTPEARLEQARDLQKLKKDKQEKKPDKKSVEPLPKPNEKVYQKNQLKFKYEFDNSSDILLKLKVTVPKQFETSMLKVDLEDKFVRITLKEKFLQLTFEHEIIKSKYTLERSILSGVLVLTMLKKGNEQYLNEDIKDLDLKLFKKKVNEPNVKENSKTDFKNKFSKNKRLEKFGFNSTNQEENSLNSVVDIKNIYKLKDENNLASEKKSCLGEIRNVKFLNSDLKVKIDDDFVDDPNVPPLC
ncbi:hypothetical protein HDU92_001132 [Lobulomyces angularis]|nr:hypothetical protein HDU92_001132 [Lobulomyces angularis]